MRLYIIRHADPDYENDTITPAGHLEAQALARRLATEGIDRIYCSPKGRALHTMRYTADMLQMPYLIEDWMKELSDWRTEETPWGQLMAWDVPGEIIRHQDPLPTYNTWHHVLHLENPMFQERFTWVKQQSDEFLEHLGYKREDGRYRCIKANRLKIAVFCHNGLGLTWLAHLLEIPLALMWSGFWLATTSVTTILFDERSEEWAVPRCLGLSDVSHLYEARLPLRTSGIKANFY